MKSFKDRVVVITGAGSGMGRSYAKMFGRLGSKLALCDFEEKTLLETVNLIQSQYGLTPLFVKLDVSDRSAANAFATQVKQTLGNAHVVINNAGISGHNGPVWEVPDSSYERVMAVNFWGVVYGTRAFLPQMIENKEGALVNVSSVFGLVGTPNNSDYCASKFAVRGFTESLAVELSSTKIQVHLVYPGGINTNISANSKSKQLSKKFLTTSPDEIVEVVRRGIEKNEPRIVYGNKSELVWFGARFLPFSIFRKILWEQMSPTFDLTPYRPLR